VGIFPQVVAQEGVPEEDPSPHLVHLEEEVYGMEGVGLPSDTHLPSYLPIMVSWVLTLLFFPCIL